jgi:hypothetical protein
MTTATVFQFGRRGETTQEVTLPAYVQETCEFLENGRVTVGYNSHQLSDGEVYGAGSGALYRVISGTC